MKAHQPGRKYRDRGQSKQDILVLFPVNSDMFSGPAIFKIVVVVLLAIILISLASGLIFLIRDKGKSDRTVKSLTLRIALSIALFVLLFIGFAAGLIKPHGINPSAPPETLP
jgi:uncharacterized membrane protein